MIGWQDWRPHTRAHAAAHVDWEVARLDRLGLLDAMTMVPLPPPLIGAPIGEPGEAFPVPSEIANPAATSTPLSAPTGLPLLAPEGGDACVILGVIDIDIALAHRRFRTASGATRVLAAWQQGAPWPEGSSAPLPFGQALTAGEIDARMAAHGAGGGAGAGGPVAHEAFYQELGLITPGRAAGPGGLAHGTAHGTHVMGRAAGQDPADDPEGFAENVRLLVVNLPPAAFFGEGGAFLDYYLSYGLAWIRATYEAFVTQNIVAGRIAQAPPLLVNVSFGKQAGAPAASGGGTGELLLFPVGNDNLDRCHALFDLGADDQSLALRVQPDDATSNVIEIWALEEFAPGADGGPPDGPLPLEVALELPDAAEAGFGTPADGAVRDLDGALGRIYCDWLRVAESGSYRLRYLICLAPDRFRAPAEPGLRGAPAGRYRLRLRKGSGEARLSVRARIQTDAAALPSARNARRAAFDDPAYLRFEPTGRVADSYAYPSDPGDAGFDGTSPIRRHGTTNSYAASPGVLAIAGFRLNDGRPAAYSATGLGFADAAWGRPAPTAALPSDDGAAHVGVLSDGARDGAVVALSGTSFATAAATRLVAETVLAARRAGCAPDLKGAFTALAPPAHWPSATVPVAKAGLGRVVTLSRRPVARI